VISLFALVILSILSGTILNKKYIKKTFEKSGYYSVTDEYIKKEFENYAIQAGLNKSVLENLYDIEKLKNDTNSLLDTIYENKELNIDAETLKVRLEERINEELERNGETINEEEKEAVKKFENNIVKVYESSVIYSQKYVTKIGEIFEKITNIFAKVQIAVIIITVILVAIILIINRKNIKESIKTFGVTALTTGTLQIFLRILIGNRLDHITILSDAFSDALIYLVGVIKSRILIFGIIMLILGFLGIIIGNIEKGEKQNDKNINETNKGI